MNVTILGSTYPVILPTWHAERHELVVCYATATARGAAAMLGLCVPGLWTPKEKGGAGLVQAWTYKSCGRDAGDYGARCWEALHVAGVTEAAFISECQPIFMALVGSVVTVDEVADKVGFSEASGGA